MKRENEECINPRGNPKIITKNSTSNPKNGKKTEKICKRCILSN